MIVTVTMNPAIDKTVDIGKFEHGGLNRIKNVEIDAGGKGINVSKTIKELGGETIATGFIGGTTGQLIENVLNEMGIKNDFVKIESPTRTNTKLVEEGGIVTELNEPGPVITEEAMEELLTKLEGYASEETLFVLAGSVPASVDKGIYGKISDAVHKKGAKRLEEFELPKIKDDEILVKVMSDSICMSTYKLVEEGGIVTELNEPGPVITDEAMKELLDKLEGYASEETLFVHAGSVPTSVDKGIYGKIADAVHEKGAKVFIDADGELFVKSLDSKPDYIKPNNVELAEFL